MIFTPENCDKVLSGYKTMTRRVVKPGDTINRVVLESTGVKVAMYAHAMKPDTKVTSVWRDGRLVWRVGNTYAVCPGRGKKAVAHIKITAIGREKVQDISNDDIKRELGPVRQPGETWISYWIAMWLSLYGNDTVKGWEANPWVWVLSFEVVTP